MYRIYIMVLVIVLHFMNVQNIYYGTCYCTAVYECTEYILYYLLLYCSI